MGRKGRRNENLALDLGTILKSAAVHLELMQDGERIIHHGAGQGELHNDTEIKADRDLGLLLQRKLSDIPGAGIVTVEGLDKELVLNPEGLWITCDPLDESLGWRVARHVLLPYAGVVTILRKKENALFGDVIAAGIKDYRAGGPVWLAWLDEESGQYHCTFNGQPAKVSDCSKLTLKDRIGFAEGYYPMNRLRVARAMKDLRGRVRNSGCAAFEMALVAAGVSDFWICCSQKQHELGAAMACTLGAGGVAYGGAHTPGTHQALHDQRFVDLRELPFTFNAQTDVILANNENVGMEIADRLNKVNWI